ncbi:hypothetical protein AXF46_23460, partial [Salmonella enterica]|nr:hypothetical protein [Salmonella enterica]
MENQIIHFSPICHTKFLKSTNFTLSSLVLALFFSSNVTYAAGEVTIGDNPMASPYGIAIGSEAKASGSGSVAIGAGADSKENLGISVGGNTTAMGESSVVIGDSGIAEGKQSVALGANSRAKNAYEVNIGIWSNDGLKLYGTRTLSGLSAGTKDDEAVNKKQLDTAIASISGGVSAEEAQKMADTAQHKAVTEAKTHTDTEISNVLNSVSSTAADGFAIGKNAHAIGNASTATGMFATAAGNNSVALGANSIADQDNQVSIGQKITTIDGVKYITRTLSNLTDGTDAHDAVNKGQLDTAKTDAIDAAKGYTDTAKTAAISEAKNHTDSEINKVLNSGSS